MISYYRIIIITVISAKFETVLQSALPEVNSKILTNYTGMIQHPGSPVSERDQSVK